MAEILLSTLNAKYIHASFGLRCLLANLGDLRPRTELLEFDIHQRPLDIAEALLAKRPRIIGLGVYIWNVQPTTVLVRALKRIQPGVRIVLGGPEVSHETRDQEIVHLSDLVITGEADLALAPALRPWLEGREAPDRIVAAPIPDLNQLTLPYNDYTQEDINHRVVYVEASRGCPFTCEFCLSSLEVPVRQFPLDRFLSSMQQLIDRGLRQFKFVDRTFNLNLSTSRAILQFFLGQHQPGRFYHFEMIPDRFPAPLRDLVAQFPAGAVQFEVGIQTFDPQASHLISRRQNLDALEDNFRFLRDRTGVHVHADLIVGLPGEDLESFGRGFDRLIRLEPQEIQVGILKRLRGTPIVRHDKEWGMVYSADPPYEILRTSRVNFDEMQRMRRFARYWDLVGNSGNFKNTVRSLWMDGRSPFATFQKLSDWLFLHLHRTDQIALARLAELVLEFLINDMAMKPSEAASLIWKDYCLEGGREIPSFLKLHLPEALTTLPRHPRPAIPPPETPKRQARHLTRTFHSPQKD